MVAQKLNRVIFSIIPMKIDHYKSQSQRLAKKRWGFSLLEILMVVATISTLSSLAFIKITNTTQSVKATKLTAEVATLNSALRTYMMNGGDLTAVTSGTEVIEKLKTITQSSQRSRIAGLRGRMIDSRIRGIASTGNGAPRAVWDNVKKSFFVQSNGNGFSEFVLDQGVAAAPKEESRQALLELNNRDKWIWAFENGTPPTGQTGITSPASPVYLSPATPSDRIMVQLEAPGFSLDSGTYPLKKFDLPLTLKNPNPPSLSEIVYAINGGSYVVYKSPLSIPPNTTVTAYIKSLNSDEWLDSKTEERTFTATLIPLDLNFALSATKVTYAQIGGRMLPGGPGVAVVPPGWATIANLSDIPSSQQNSSVFLILWTYDGKNPLTSGNSVRGDGFSNGFPGQAVSIGPDRWGSGNSLNIRIVALSLNPLFVTTSNILTKNLDAQSTDLRAPLITQNSTTGIITMTLDTTFGDMPEGARIFYTTDGKEPETNKTTPGNAILYTGPFAGAGTIKAGVYPPVDAAAWFNNSPVSTYISPLSQKLITPEIALSSPVFSKTSPSITVTLTNPNPTGISQVFYAVKQPAADYPAVTAWLPYTVPFAVTSSTYPDGFHVKAYAKSLNPSGYQDSDSNEGATSAEFFDIALLPEVFLVIDASGSMSANWANTNRFERVIREAVTAINSMLPTQKFNVITFNGGLHWANGIRDLQLATPANKLAATTALLALRSIGATNYEIGLKYALSLTTRPKQVIFLSDGQPNYMNYLDEVDTLKGLGIKIDTIGIGSSLSQAPLQQMASLSNGTYRFVSEPSTGGNLAAPVFSAPGTALDYFKDLPYTVTLTNPNTLKDPNSRIRYSINGGPVQIYTGKLTVNTDTQVDAYCDSTNELWITSPIVTETWTIKRFNAADPAVKLSVGKFMDNKLTTTVTIDNNNPAGLTTLIYWFSTQTEAQAKPYTGPFTLNAADWNTYAAADLKAIKVYARAVSAASFVLNSKDINAGLSNETTAFKNYLSKTPLDPPDFSISGGTFDYTAFPMSIKVENPESRGSGGNKFLNLWMSLNGAPFQAITGPVSVSIGDNIAAYVKVDAASSATNRDSATITETYTARTISLSNPTITLSAKEFNSTVKTIDVSLANPNAAAGSKLIYWWEGQNEATQAVTYTGPFQLFNADWESYVQNGKSSAKLYVRAVGLQSYFKNSNTATAGLANKN